MKDIKNKIMIIDSRENTLVRNFDIENQSALPFIKSVALKYSHRYFSDYGNRKDAIQECLIGIWIDYQRPGFRERYDHMMIRNLVCKYLRKYWFQYKSKNKLYDKSVEIENLPLREKYFQYFNKKFDINEGFNMLLKQQYDELIGIDKTEILKLLTDGYNYHEIAKILNKSHFYVGITCREIKEKLKSVLNEEYSYILKRPEISKFPGVIVYKKSKKYYINAIVKYKGQSISLGHFESQIEAHKAYKEAQECIKNKLPLKIKRTTSSVSRHTEVFFKNEWISFDSAEKCRKFIEQETGKELNKAGFQYAILHTGKYQGYQFRYISEQSITHKKDYYIELK